MEPEPNNNNKALHTLAEDMALALEKNENGMVKKIIEEEEKKEEERKQRALYALKSKIYIAFAILFLVLAGSVVSIVYFKENPFTFFIEKRFTPIIFHESTKIVNISNNDKDEIVDQINNTILKNDLIQGEILGIYLRDNNKTLTFDNFLKRLESPFIYSQGTFEDNFLLGTLIKDVKEKIEEEKKVINKDPKKILDNFVTFSSKDFFLPSKLEFIDINTENKMRELIGYFLDILNLDVDKIQVYGIYPNENKNSKNESEANLYKDFGINILNQMLKEKYSEEELKSLILESGIKGIGLTDLYLENELNLMNENDKKTLISLNAGFQLISIPKATINLEEGINSIEKPKVDITKPVSSIYKNATNVFILLNIKEGKNVFSAMRTWENKMFADLHDIFGIPLSLDTGYLLTKNFEDSIVQNKNARILRDGSGKIVLMYVYIDNKTLVITNTEEGAKEIIFRVNSSKVKK